MQPDPSNYNVEEQALEVLGQYLAENPLPDAPPEEQELEGIYHLNSPTASKLHCLGLIRNGMIMPYIDLDQIPEPRTPGEKMHYMTFIARTILDGLMDALLLAEERLRQRGQQPENGDDGEEEGPCYV